MGAKNTYEQSDFLSTQKILNRKEVYPPVVGKISWNKHNIDDNYYFVSKGKESQTCVIYFHGGGFVSGPTIFHWNYTNKLRKRLKLPVYLPIYPKAPEHNFETAYEFLHKFYKQVLKTHPNNNFVFIGDSAGGNIALSFAMQLKEKKLKLPEKIILFSPCLDLTFSNKQIDEIEKQDLDPMLSKKGLKAMSKLWAGKDKKLSSWRLSPINGDLKSLKNILLFVGTHEILHPEAITLSSLAKTKNINLTFIEGQGLNHAWPLHPIKEAKKAFKQVRHFISK